MKNIFKPMLFSTSMVQAILDYRKKITRRTKGLEEINLNPNQWKLLTSFENPNDKSTAFYSRIGNELFVQFSSKRKNLDIKVPYQIGNIIWVRETIMDASWPDEPAFIYKTDLLEDAIKLVKWKPSIFMPKEACRFFLKVKTVKIERLQDISEEDAKLEGVSDKLNHCDIKLLEGLGNWKIPRPFQYFQFGFMAIWCKINGCESWLKNPWVWVIEFERIEKPLDFIV